MTGISNRRTANWVAGIAVLAFAAAVAGYGGHVDYGMDHKAAATTIGSDKKGTADDSSGTRVTAEAWFHEKAWSLD
ncbi:hypothetical protein [Streptomyces mirabilis]